MILVTGGTGLVGSHLLYKLAKQNLKVRAIYRSKTSLKKTQQVFAYYSTDWEILFNTIEWVKADLSNLPQLELAFTDVSTVYHTAAYISFNPKKYSVAKKTNSIGTANMVNLSLAYGISKFCHVSSIATLDENNHEPIDEQADWTPEKNKHNIYAITKYQAELEVWRGIQEGLPAVIVNPGLILGPGFWNSGSGTIFSQIAKGRNYYTNGTVGCIGVLDVVKCMIYLTQNNLILNRFILVSENVSYKNLALWIGEAFNNNAAPKGLSKKQLFVLWKIDQLLSSLHLKKPVLFKSNYLSAFKKLTYSNKKILKNTPFSLTPIKEVINTTVSYF